jgi:phage-related protein
MTVMPTAPQAPVGDSEFAPEIMAAFRLAVSALEKALKELETAWNNLIDAVNQFLQRVQQWLDSNNLWAKAVEWFTDDVGKAVDWILALVEEIRPKITQWLEQLRKTIGGSIPVGSLFQVGLDWATKVNPQLSELGPDMTGSGKVDFWRGPAKITYEKRVKDQCDAVDGSVAKVKATSTWLADVARSNTDYMTQLAALVAQVVSSLVATVASISESAAGAVTQVPLALQDFGELIGTSIGTMIQHGVGLANRLSEVMGKIVELATEYGDHSGLPGGKWPKAVNA